MSSNNIYLQILIPFSTIGKHWSAEKIANTFAPAKKTTDGVEDWLVKSGIDATRHTYSTGMSRVDYSSNFYTRLGFRSFFLLKFDFICFENTGIYEMEHFEI